MAEIRVNASASITARGTTTATGTLTWSAPSLPADATLESIHVVGTWSWGGKGSINHVNINGTNTTGGIAFDVNITGKSSPLSISCAGNKNATGSSFTWSGLQVVYTYSVPSTGPVLKMKSSGSWVEVSEVYKKINGSWVKQTDLESLFSITANYVKGN